jgi:hypothetical protein
MFVNKVRLLAVPFLAGACATLGLAAPPAFATSSGVGPITDVSSACPGQNAEVEQAVAPRPRLHDPVRRYTVARLRGNGCGDTARQLDHE